LEICLNQPTCTSCTLHPIWWWGQGRTTSQYIVCDRHGWLHSYEWWQNTSWSPQTD